MSLADAEGFLCLEQKLSVSKQPALSAQRETDTAFFVTPAVSFTTSEGEAEIVLTKV